jgi:hypothetical protein
MILPSAAWSTGRSRRLLRVVQRGYSECGFRQGLTVAGQEMRERFPEGKETADQIQNCGGEIDRFFNMNHIY